MKRMAGCIFLAALTIVLIAGCATMNSRWGAAESVDTIAAYEDFLKEYPEGDLADRARVRKKELYEQRDWREAEALHTISAYADYIRNYPQGRHRDDAHARLETLAPQKGKDLPFMTNEAFLKGYEGYLNQYPQGTFADEARSRREELSAPGARPAWGSIMYPKAKANIRAKRSAASRWKGQLKEGQPVKVDFLQDGWYAAFPVTEEQRNEKKALGYVYASLLTAKREPDSSGSTAYGEKSAEDAPAESSEAESPSVDIKNIAFRITEDGKELLLIELNRFYSPAISGIEGEEPRIMLEIKNASLLKKDWAVIDTGGKFIRKIRSRMDPKTHAALIVLDMEPLKNYYVNPKFYEKDNTYSLEISEEKEISLP